MVYIVIKESYYKEAGGGIDNRNGKSEHNNAGR